MKKYKLIGCLSILMLSSCVSTIHSKYDICMKLTLKKIIKFHSHEIPNQIIKSSKNNRESLLCYLLQYSRNLSWFEQRCIIDYFENRIFIKKDIQFAKKTDKMLLSVYPLYKKSHLRKKIISLIRKQTIEKKWINKTIEELNNTQENKLVRNILLIRKIKLDNFFKNSIIKMHDDSSNNLSNSHILFNRQSLPEKLLSYKDKIAENFSRYSDFEARKKNTWLMYYYIASNEITEEDAIAILHNIIIEFTEKVLNSNIDSELIHNKKVLRCAIWKLNYHNNILSRNILSNIILNYKLCKKNNDILKEALETYIAITPFDSELFKLPKKMINISFINHGEYIPTETDYYFSELLIKKLQFDAQSNIFQNDSNYYKINELINHSIVHKQNEHFETLYQYNKLCMKIYPDYKYIDVRYKNAKYVISNLPPITDVNNLYKKYFSEINKQAAYNNHLNKTPPISNRKYNLRIMQTKEYNGH